MYHTQLTGKQGTEQREEHPVVSGEEDPALEVGDALLGALGLEPDESGQQRQHHSEHQVQPTQHPRTGLLEIPDGEHLWREAQNMTSEQASSIRRRS